MKRILEAAAAEFAEQGLGAAVADIARRAGVGTGTIFRRFATKEDLVAAVLEARLIEMRDAAIEAAGCDDAMQGLKDFIESAVVLHTHDRTALECAGTAVFNAEPIRALLDETLDVVGDLIDRAQASGQLRNELVTQDIPVMVLGLAHSARMTARASPDAWRRYLQIAFDGLRPGGTRIEFAPPTREEFEYFATESRDR